jgi:hypothetical protein
MNTPRPTTLSLLALAAVSTLAPGGRSSAAEGRSSPADGLVHEAALESPFGLGTPVNVTVGTLQGSPWQYVVWQNRVTQECRSTLIGDGYGPFAILTVISGSDAESAQPGAYDDQFFVVTSGTTSVDCAGSAPVTLTAPVIPGWVTLSVGAEAFVHLDLHGRKGRDLMVAPMRAVEMFGDEGNDRLVGRSLNGGEGDDTLVAPMRSETYEVLRGGPGDDCIQDANAEADEVDCGTGHDLYVTPLDGHFMSGCEEPVTRCPAK